MEIVVGNYMDPWISPYIIYWYLRLIQCGGTDRPLLLLSNGIEL